MDGKRAKPKSNEIHHSYPVVITTRFTGNKDSIFNTNRCNCSLGQFQSNVSVTKTLVLRVLTTLMVFKTVNLDLIKHRLDVSQI